MDGRLFGVVHLRALPGSPRYEGDRAAVLESARADAGAYLDGGLDGIVVENFGDVPFHKADAGVAVVAEMTRVTTALVELAGADHPVGVNVLRNDAAAALAVAGASGASFIRVNVHTGVQFTDQGILEGRAAETLRLRRALDLGEVTILADVWVKHAVPPQGERLEDAARDAAHRGLADGLIVTGGATGAAPSADDLRAVRAAVPDRPLFAGSGVTPANVAEVLALADGVIVGTSLKETGDVRRRVDTARVKELVRASR